MDKLSDPNVRNRLANNPAVRLTTRKSFCRALLLVLAIGLLVVLYNRSKANGRRTDDGWRGWWWSSAGRQSPAVTSGQSGMVDPACRRLYQSLFDTHRQCLSSAIDGKSAWQELFAGVPRCFGDALWRRLQARTLYNSDDVKLAILPADFDHPEVSRRPPCNELTLGVGNDILAEKALRKLMPHCRFFGADPILESGKPFVEMGSYFQIAVADTSGTVNASVLENGKYIDKQVKAVTVVDFLRHYANVSRIDYWFLDNEGPEYQLLRQLERGQVIDQNGLVFCQISVELHAPLEKYGTNQAQFNDLIKLVLTRSAYLPVWISGGYHMRLFLINIEHEYCLRLYLDDKFC